MPAARRTCSPVNSEADYLIIVEFYKKLFSQQIKFPPDFKAFLLWHKLQLIKQRYYLLLPRVSNFCCNLHLVIYCCEHEISSSFLATRFSFYCALFGTIHFHFAHDCVKRNFSVSGVQKNVIFSYLAKVKWSAKHKAATTRWKISVHSTFDVLAESAILSIIVHRSSKLQLCQWNIPG